MNDEVTRARVGEALGPLGALTVVSLVTGRVSVAIIDARPGIGAQSGVLMLAAGCAVASLPIAARRLRPWTATILLLFVAVLVMFTAIVVRLETTTMGLVPGLVDRGGVVVIEAKVAAEPRKGTLGWQTALRVSAVEGHATRERVNATLDGALPLGTPVVLRASARPLPDGGYGRWLRQQHAVAMLDVREVHVTGSPGSFTSSSEFVRERIRSAATRHLDDDVGGLLVGFVTGDTRLLPDADVEAMQATGLSHLTAVSGSNTAVLLAGIAFVLSVARIAARVRWGLLALVVPWFAFLTRLEPSVLRAGTMALLVIATAIRGVARDPRHLLAGAVLLLLVIDPMLSWSLGLLLSAGATLGVLVLAPVLAARFARSLPRPVAALLGITLGAQLAVAPVLLMSFGRIETVSVPANMLAVPLAAVGAAIAFVASALALVSPAAAGSVFVLASPAAWGVLRVARLGERFAGGLLLGGWIPSGVLMGGGRGVVAGGMLVVLARGAVRRSGRAGSRPAPVTLRTVGVSARSAPEVEIEAMKEQYGAQRNN